jgi:HPt (histidine-containing phosphotransfer) domain-containing protein
VTEGPESEDAGRTDPADGSAQADPVPEPIDRSRLGILHRSGGPGLIAELVELFVGDVPARLDAIRKAMSAADPDALQRTAHSLKGSAATLGADGMAEICRCMEMHGRAGEVAEAAALLDSLDAEFERVRDALEAWVAAL